MCLLNLFAPNAFNQVKVSNGMAGCCSCSALLKGSIRCLPLGGNKRKSGPVKLA